jgi:hypothetical protein
MLASATLDLEGEAGGERVCSEERASANGLGLGFRVRVRVRVHHP